MARLAVNGDGATVAADDAVNDGEAEAGALADGLGGEEGIEDAVEGGAIHAAAVVADGEADVGTFVQTGA